MDNLSSIQVEIEKQPKNSWRRMYAELRIGQMFGLCGKNTDSYKWLDAALEKSKTIYIEGSEGQKYMQKRVDAIIDRLEM